jgi:hypothetical protein
MGEAEQRVECSSYIGCIVGALTIAEYRIGRAAAGFTP